MNTNLYVVTHKKIENKIPKNRKIIIVGSKNKSIPDGYYKDFDNVNDDISDKNNNYCELTALYYISRYDFADVLGLEHYRRFFIKRELYLFKYPFLDLKSVNKLMQKYDIILPRKCKLKNSVYEEYCKEHYKSDIDLTRDIIAKKHKEYLPSFDAIMGGNKLYYCNMFIGKSSIIRDYSKWLFDILFELEKQIDLSDRDTYQKRVFGFLSERLFNVWLNFHSEIAKKEFPVLLLNCSPFMSQIKRVYRKLFCRNK